jgi:type I restriction enzyme S subunit
MTAFPLVQLGNLCRFVSGGTPRRNVERYFEGDIPWITGIDVTEDVITKARHYITEEAIQSSATNIVPAGNILLVTRTGVGKVAIAGVDICISQDFTGLLPDISKVDTRFLFYYLRAQQEYFVANQRGATIQGVTREAVSKLRVPLPPLPEQQRIAEVLSKADRLRRLRRTARELSDTYLQSVFLGMFYTNAPPGWPLVKITSLAKKGKNTIRTGPFGSQLLHSEFVDKGIAVLGIDNAVQNRFVWAKPRFITSEKYQQLKRYTVFPGDVLITIMGTTGRCAIVPGDVPLAINTKHLCCITLNRSKCLPTYLKWCFLAHPSILRQLGGSERGAIMAGLNMGIIKNLDISLPPLPLQQEFAHIVHKFEHLRAQQREAERQSEHLFQTLLHRAFQGES